MSHNYLKKSPAKMHVYQQTCYFCGVDNWHGLVSQWKYVPLSKKSLAKMHMYQMPTDLIFCGRIDTWSSFQVKNVPLSVCIKKSTTMLGHRPGHEVELMMFLKLYTYISQIGKYCKPIKWGLVCCKIINHGWNYGLMYLPF